LASNESSVVKPGLSVRIVTELDIAKERISVKSSIVHDVKGESLILAQPDPPILKSMLGKDIFVTYLVKKGDEVARNGFPARIDEFIDYGLFSGRKAKAIVATVTGETRPYNIRMFYRVTPTGRSGLSMKVYNTPVNLLDISLGGARISHDKSLKLEARTVIEVNMEANGKPYTLKARILRTWDGTDEGFGSHLRFASMEFVDMDKTTEHVLSQKIFDIERELLARGLEQEKKPRKPNRETGEAEV
jgi:hypothetical protein